jgi:hypothetical protein
METRVAEVAEGVHQLATFFPEMNFGSLSLHPSSSATIRRLAELDVDTLALMHGSTFNGDCRTALLELAGDYERRIAALV